MIVYIFYNDFYKKIVLPQRVIGIYPVYLNESRVLINIEASDNTWKVKPADTFVILENGNEVEYPTLKEYNTYIITNHSFYIYMVATPQFVLNDNYLKIDTNSFSFGSALNNSISFKNSSIKELEYTIQKTEQGYWEILSDTKNVYLNDKMVSRSYLFAGDTIFCFGVKLLFFGDFILINGPEEVKVDDKVFLASSVLAPTLNNVSNNEVLDDLPLYTKNDYFIKSPRFMTDSDEVEIEIEGLSIEEKKDDLPLILTLGPQLTMLSVSVLSFVDVVVDFVEGTIESNKFYTSLVTFGVMLAGVLFWPLITKIYNDKRAKSKMKAKKLKYKKYLDKKVQDIEDEKKRQVQVLNDKYPSLEECVSIIENKKNNLWMKNVDDDDFMEISLGIGTVPSKIIVKAPLISESFDDEMKKNTNLESIIDNSKYINNVPFAFSFAEHYLSAVLGENNLVYHFMNNVFLQLMTFHSYSDLKIVIFTSEENEDKWDFLKILPHCWDNQHNVRYFTTNVEEFNEVAVELDSAFDHRKTQSDNEKLEDDGRDDSNVEPYKLHKPYYFIFTDSIDAIRNTSIIKKVLNYKKNLGFSLFVVNDSLGTLPDQMNTFISVTEELSGMFTNTLKFNQHNNEFRVDFNTLYDINRCSQILANTPIQLEKGKYELPKSLSFLEMFKVGRVEQLNSLDRWKNNNPTNSLSVPVGIDQNGELFKMDLHEKVYGPHGLVAGTTGSGKSEWIVTLILSLAVNFNPDEVQFVLVDYKGGGLAMSFENKELGIKLPHLAGTITNLDKSAINRSISSIESELKRRQSIFNDAREKLKESSMDIYKYQQFYRKGLVSTPLSHLFIICDEFAELKQQQPEFMEQLISTSRIGRSLGVHLILATQKPTGVVNDQIWSNSRFKVCLRVQDVSDSNEILKKPDAAYLKQAGAFYLEVGSDEYYNLGQAAWAGAKYYPSDVVSREVDQSVQYINHIGKVLNYYDDIGTNNKSENSQGEELLNVVKYIDEISRGDSFVKQQLWLPNIPENITIEDVKKRYQFTSSKFNFTTVIGEYDEPRKQEQGMLSINLSDGNIAIVGQPGSGKELLISSIIFSSITDHTPDEINYYILDFGAETLRKFSKFPHVGEVVFQDDMERVGGVIQLIMDELNRRKVLFQDYNGSLKFYNEHSGQTLPMLVLVINAYDVFSEVLSRVVDSLTSLFRDAPRYGIIFILSASAQNTFRSRVLQFFNRFILLNLQDETQYRGLTNCRKGLIPSNCYGRGICKVTDDDDSYSEFQTAKIIDSDKELAYLKQVADVLNNGYTTRAKKITTIPDNITSADLAKYVTTIADIPIGYNFYEKDVAKLDLSSTKVYPIITKDLKSNINFIYALANLLTKIPNTVIRVIDIVKIFDKPILDIKLFKDQLGDVFAALEKDVTDRNDTQPLAINLIIGAASIKQVLPADAAVHAMNMFAHMDQAKQNIYILIDNYKQFKLLKLEPWYNKINTSNGIWLGQGIESQSVLVTNDLSEEDKKYNYEGMAYFVNNGSYTLIKTMMDGDD